MDPCGASAPQKGKHGNSHSHEFETSVDDSTTNVPSTILRPPCGALIEPHDLLRLRPPNLRLSAAARWLADPRRSSRGGRPLEPVRFKSIETDPYLALLPPLSCLPGLQEDSTRYRLLWVRLVTFGTQDQRALACSTRHFQLCATDAQVDDDRGIPLDEHVSAQDNSSYCLCGAFQFQCEKSVS